MYKQFQTILSWSGQFMDIHNMILFYAFYMFRSQVIEIFAILLQYFNNLGTIICYAIEIHVFLHLCGINTFILHGPFYCKEGTKKTQWMKLQAVRETSLILKLDLIIHLASETNPDWTALSFKRGVMKENVSFSFESNPMCCWYVTIKIQDKRHVYQRC